jgi:glycosyltransferase involved in cell wall biosynthesis
VDDSGRWLLDLANRYDPDVIHLNGYCHGALQFHAPIVMTAHSCVLSWWLAVHGTDAPPEWDRYADHVRRGLLGADLVVAPTASMLSSLNTHYGPLRRTRVISNGTAIPDPRSPIPDPSQPFVFSSGRLWDPAKNIELLAQAAPEIAWPVYVAGDVTGPSGASATLPNVHVLGRLAPQAVREWMQRADIYALPARYEPFGLSVLEAALAGCALVLGDIRSLREVWGDAALYIPADNRRALIAALRTCIDDAALREELGARARGRALGLTAERMAAAYCAAYGELAASAVAV